MSSFRFCECSNENYRNIIREKFNVSDTSSAGENCGLVSLHPFVIDPVETRRRFNLPDGRLSGEELAMVTSKFQIALLIVQVVYSDDMTIDHLGNVNVSGYGLTLHVPNDDVCDFVALLNEHGHFSPMSKRDNSMVLPRDITDTISSINGSNYTMITNTVFTDFHTQMMRLNGKLVSMFGISL